MSYLFHRGRQFRKLSRFRIFQVNNRKRVVIPTIFFVLLFYELVDQQMTNTNYRRKFFFGKLLADKNKSTFSLASRLIVEVF